MQNRLRTLLIVAMIVPEMVPLRPHRTRESQADITKWSEPEPVERPTDEDFTNFMSDEGAGRRVGEWLRYEGRQGTRLDPSYPLHYGSPRR
jgi:hypothetical protein